MEQVIRDQKLNPPPDPGFYMRDTYLNASR